MSQSVFIVGLNKAFICTSFLCLASAHAEVSVSKDVQYLETGRAQMMDIYTPSEADAKALPAVLLIHGGGWVGGDKADKRGVSISTDLSEHGFVVFAINYLVAQKDAGADTPGEFPQNLFDCKSALRYIRKNADQYHVDPHRIGVLGESAGGHLAVLLGLTSQVGSLNHGGLYTEEENTVSCIVDMYGIPDLSDKSMPFITPPFRGKDDTETKQNLRLANPIRYLTKNAPPILVIHGTADKLVPLSQSIRFVARLNELGVAHEFVEVPYGPHGFDLHPQQMDIRSDVFSFLDKYLGASRK